MSHLSIQMMPLSAITLGLLCLSACEPVNSGAKAWGDDGKGKSELPAASTEDLEAKRTSETFIKALKDRRPKDLLAVSVVAGAFRYFLPEAFDGAGKEETIANAAAQSEDKRLRKLSDSSFYDTLPGDVPGKVLAIYSEPPPIAGQPGALQTLEVQQVASGYRVVQIGSNAFGDGGGKWVVNQCSAFAAPFKVPAALSPKPNFEPCSESLKNLKQQLTNKSSDALGTLTAYLDGQPYVEHRKQKAAEVAKHEYGIGEDQKAFKYGLSEGDLIRYQFLLSMGSYCGCLPSEKAIK